MRNKIVTLLVIEFPRTGTNL